jgi:hypothetical protein
MFLVLQQLKLYSMTNLIKIAFSVTVNKLQGQTFKRLGIHLPLPVFPMASSMWYFSEYLHDYITVTTIEKHRQHIEKYIYNLTSNIGHTEVFQVSKIHIIFLLIPT